MKLIIKKIFKFFGLKIMSTNSVDTIDINNLTKTLINTGNEIIFDVGANIGQSIERYKKLYSNPTIHSFEPTHEAKILIQKYINDKKVHVNNVAVGEENLIQDFNINYASDHSSFNDLIPNTTWIKKRSKSVNINSNDYTVKKVPIKVIKLDDYVIKKNIEQIDILKIDTQGYENKVLSGAKELIQKNKIKLIQIELIFSEIYENSIQINDIEKILIPNNYKLFGISNGGSLNSNYIFQADFIYVSNEIYEEYKLKSPFFNN